MVTKATKDRRGSNIARRRPDSAGGEFFCAATDSSALSAELTYSWKNSRMASDRDVAQTVYTNGFVREEFKVSKLVGKRSVPVGLLVVCWPAVEQETDWSRSHKTIFHDCNRRSDFCLPLRSFKASFTTD